MIDDVRRIAADLGHAMATSTAAHSAVIEARITKSTIYPFPVALEPAFRPFDPLLTFERERERTATPAEPPTSWVMQRLILPVSDTVDWHQAEAALAGLAGCKSTLSFEIHATHDNAEFYLGAPPATSAFLAHAWLAAYPNSAITPTPDPLDHPFPEDLALCDLYSPAPYHRSMRTHPPVTPWRHLLRLCTNLKADETLFVQVLFTPAAQPWHRNIAALLLAEQLLGARAPHGRTTAPKNPSEPLFAASIRIGSTNPALAASIESFAGTYTADGKPFLYRTINDYRRVLTKEELAESLRERTNHTTGQILALGELGTFVHPPDQATGDIVRLTFLQGLPVPAALRLPGVPLGTNNDRGEPITVFQPEHQDNKSAWLVGASGMGKSTMIVHQCAHHASCGLGVGLIDPHGTTAIDLLNNLDHVPPERVVYLDFDSDTPVAYNPFADQNPEDYGRLTTEYTHTFKHLMGAEHFHRMTHGLGMGIYSLFALGENLATLPDLLAKTPGGNALRKRAATLVKNETVHRFLREEYDKYPPEAFAPITNRLSALLLDEKTRRTFTQRENRVHIARIMDEGQLLIIATPRNFEAGSIIGGMIIAQAQHAAFRRAGTTRARQHFQFVIDEFPRFITSANTLQSIIDETRKGGLGVCLANQETGQIPNDLLKAILSIPNIFVFGVNLPDAKTLSPLFNGAVSAETLAGQRTGEVHARINGHLANFTVPPPAQTQDNALAERILAHSKATYYASASPTTPASPRPARRVIDTIPEE